MISYRKSDLFDRIRYNDAATGAFTLVIDFPTENHGQSFTKNGKGLYIAQTFLETRFNESQWNDVRESVIAKIEHAIGLSFSTLLTSEPRETWDDFSKRCKNIMVDRLQKISLSQVHAVPQTVGRYQWKIDFSMRLV